MDECQCCGWKPVRTNDIREDIIRDLEIHLEDLNSLEHHFSYQEGDDLFDIPYLEEIIKEFKKRLMKTRLKGKVRLLGWGNVSPKPKDYQGIVLSYDDLGYYFSFRFEGDSAKDSSPILKVFFVPEPETDEIRRTKGYNVDWDHIEKFTEYDSEFWNEAYKLRRKESFPIGNMFGDLKRFLVIAREFSFDNSYYEFYCQLMTKIDQKENC